MIRIVRFEAEHLYMMDLLEVFKGDESVRDRVRDHSIETSCLLNTLLCPDSSVLGVVGMTLVTDGYGQMWSLLSKKVNEYPVGFHRTVGKLIKYFWEKCNLYRIDTHIDVDNFKAQKQNECWGLSREVRLKRSGPLGNDEYIYSRVR